MQACHLLKVWRTSSRGSWQRRTRTWASTAMRLARMTCRCGACKPLVNLRVLVLEYATLPSTLQRVRHAMIPFDGMVPCASMQLLAQGLQVGCTTELLALPISF